MGLTALEMRASATAPLGLRIVADGSFVLACVSGCFFVMAGCLRFGTMRSPILESLGNSAFGIYLLHYPFVVWLQYALLGVAWAALAKGATVFAAALLFAWATTAIMRRVPLGAALIGEQGRVKTGRATTGWATRSMARRDVAPGSHHAADRPGFPPPKPARQ